ncbi:hypothetical protein Trydic_g20993, partial [Trypoxylus dichotomus]
MEKPICEIQLLTATLQELPSSCRTKTINAKIEIWNPLRNNQWIFVTSQQERVTVSCPEYPIDDIIIEGTGILQLHHGCKGYTATTVLEASNEIVLKYFHPMPTVNIVDDNCCRAKIENSTINPLHIPPVQLTNIKLEELRWSYHKLQQLDDVLKQQTDRHIPVNTSTHWYSIFFSCLGSLIGVILSYKLLQWIGFINLLRRVLCCTKVTDSSSGCCARIFNTNISGVPVTRAQLRQIIEEERS